MLQMPTRYRIAYLTGSNNLQVPSTILITGSAVVRKTQNSYIVCGVTTVSW